MGFDIVASIAVILLSAAEIFSPSSLRISAILVVASVALLLASARRSYFILSILLSASAGGFAVVRKFRPSPSSSSDSATRRATANHLWSSLKALVLHLLPATLASLFHLLALWVLPFCILFGVIDARSDTAFFGQEIGHLAPATFYVVALVVLPLLVLPKGYQNATTKHQLYESVFNVGFSLIYFIVFRTAHHFRGQDPPRMSAPNWDHEFLGLVFAGAGMVGVILALQDIRTSLHISFPTGFVAMQMLSHSNSHHDNMDSMEGWRFTWMKLHAVHGMLFGIGALCRLMGRITESIFFFHIGSFAFVTSAQYVVKSLDAAVDYKADPESQAAGRYPTDHVVPLLVIAVATTMYALFLGTATRLRKFLDMDADVAGGRGAFQALPTELELVDDNEGDEKETLFRDDEEKKEDSHEVALMIA